MTFRRPKKESCGLSDTIHPADVSLTYSRQGVVSYELADQIWELIPIELAGRLALLDIVSAWVQQSLADIHRTRSLS